MELLEIIRGTQAAMDRGDYRLAAAACSHVIEAFPACLTAHRMLGEALLEQGEVEPAVEHFTRTIQTDPLNVVARLGLGVANEEKRRMEAAYTSYLHAWEINPALDQVRDELVRLRGLLNGDERLHPTRSGLAGIYERSGQFGRAASEWRAVLAADPENARAWTALAEVLWRSGDDAGGAAACREALSLCPENARALAMLADTETRRGSNAASELASRYQTVDPAGELVSLLAEWRGDLAADALRREHVPLPDFDFTAEPAARSEPLVRQGTGPVSGLVSSQFAAPDLWDSLVQDLRVDGGSAPPGAPLSGDVQPFSWIDDGVTASAGPFSMDALLDAAPAPPLAAPVAATASLEDQIAAMSGGATAPLGAAAATAAPVPAGVAAAPFGLEDGSARVAMVAAPAPELVARPTAVPSTQPPPADATPFVTADGRVDLTVGWDDLDRQLREATPSFESSREIDALAAELGVEGIVPFEMGEPGFDDAAWAPFTDDDLAPPAQAVAPQATARPPAPEPIRMPEPEPVAGPASGSPETAEPLVFDHGLQDVFAGIEPFRFEEATAADAPAVDDEIVERIPAPRSSGYTELLRNIDSEELPAFGVDEEIDPFASPDAAGAPLEFEELLAVTSRDGTAPLVPSFTGDAVPVLDWPDPPGQGVDAFTWPTGLDTSAPFETAAPSGESFSVAGMEAVLAELGDLQPFTLDENQAAVVEPAHAVDFSDFNEVPFVPASPHGAVDPPVLHPVATNGWREAEDTPVAAEPDARSSAGAWDAAPSGAVPAEPPAPASAGRRSTNRLAVGPAGVAWPAFVGQTSELIDRSVGGSDLFGRLRAAKKQGIAAGLYHVSRSLKTRQEPGHVVVDGARVVSIPAPSPAVGASRELSRGNGLSESERIDLMAMRVRLIEDESSAREVASALEAAMAGGLHDALALRVLGEAYLRLGRHEQAAAQFRQAMLTRQRARA